MWCARMSVHSFMYTYVRNNLNSNRVLIRFHFHPQRFASVMTTTKILTHNNLIGIIIGNA